MRRTQRERMVATHRERLPKELAAQGIDTMQGVNRNLAEHYRAAFYGAFAAPAAEPGTAIVPSIGPGLADIVCEHHASPFAANARVWASFAPEPPTSSRIGPERAAARQRRARRVHGQSKEN